MKPRKKSYLTGPRSVRTRARSVTSNDRRNLIHDRLFALDNDDANMPDVIVLESKVPLKHKKQTRPTLNDTGRRPSLLRQLSLGRLGRKTKSAEGLISMQKSLINPSKADQDDESLSSVESEFSDNPVQGSRENRQGKAKDASSVSSLDRIKSIAVAGLSMMSNHDRTTGLDDSCSLSSIESAFSGDGSDTKPPAISGPIQRRFSLKRYNSISSTGSNTNNQNLKRIASPRGRSKVSPRGTSKSGEEKNTLGSPRERKRSKSNEGLKRVGSPLLSKSKGKGSPRSPRRTTRSRSNEGLRELRRIASIQDEEKKEKKKERPGLLERGFSKLEKVYNDCV